MPQRIQLRRTKGWRKPDGAIVVARPSRWGNPYRVEKLELTAHGTCEGNVGAYCVDDILHIDQRIDHVHATAAMVVQLYHDELVASLDDGDPYYDEFREAFAALRGHDLACWCPLEDAAGNPVPCHADVLLRLANPEQAS